MATQEQVLDTILAAQLKAANLTNNNLTKLSGGGLSVNWKIINRIQRGINCVLRQYNLQDYSSTPFTIAYDCLLNFVGVNPGGSINPNAQNPGINIITQNPVLYLSWLDIPWEAFSTDNSPDGGISRNTYYNTSWVGANPALQDQTTTLLYLNIDYTLIPMGGFILSGSDNLPYIYQGQSLRASAYQYLGNVPVNPGTRIPEIFTDASTTPLSSTYLNATYPYPAYIEGDIIIAPAAYLQYQRQSNANPSIWTEAQYNQAGT